MTYNYKCIAIGGSAGSFSVVMDILHRLPSDFNLPIIICMHRMKSVVNEGFVNALNLKSKLKVLEPLDKQRIAENKVYLAPANYHMYVEYNKTISLSTEEDYNYSRPSIDLMFKTAAYVYKKSLLGIILSGANQDGAKGLREVKMYGGTSVIQDLNEAQVQTMPLASKKYTQIDYELTTKEIVNLLIQLHQYKQNSIANYLND